MGLRRVLSRRIRPDKQNDTTDKKGEDTESLLPPVSISEGEILEIPLPTKKSPRFIRNLIALLRLKDKRPEWKTKGERSWSDAATTDSISPLRLSEESIQEDPPVTAPLLRRSFSTTFTSKKSLKPSRSLFFRSSTAKQSENSIRPIISIPSLRRSFSTNSNPQGTVIRRKSTQENPPRASAPFTRLSTVQEQSTEDLKLVASMASLDLPHLTETASLKTVELSSAAQVYFSSHFARIGSSPSPRTIRRRTVEESMKAVKDENERAGIREAWLKSETERLRISRAKKPTVGDYEVVKVIGKGAFGVVKLVRGKVENSESDDKPLFAMKVIRKTEMIVNRQEGHLRAERDFLVASEGSRWIVPLISSFQDKENLYLITEYCVGGDFLGLLLSANTLPEEFARFYVAEMVMGIEEAHSLHYIHRDIKPDNFIFTASGHLKLCDFGLAFSGLECHDSASFLEHSTNLMRALGLESGEWESPIPLSNATNGSLRAISKTPRSRMAKSVVGTVQYMAPEILRGEMYDGRCDWWSLGIILFEILYGYTPFQSETSQFETRNKIEKWSQHLHLPHSPGVSDEAQDLILSLLTEPHLRLSASYYSQNDMPDFTAPPSTTSTIFVHPHDSTPIKSHPFFSPLNFSTLHLTTPPFIPTLESPEDTRYFEDSKGGIMQLTNTDIGSLDVRGKKREDGSGRSTGSRYARFISPKGPAEEMAIELRKEVAFLGYTYRRPSMKVTRGRVGV